MIAFGLLAVAAVSGFVGFLLGRFTRVDGSIQHEPADISVALKRSVR